ncbi:MAG TPA: sigma-54 dependent transcriptional regulator [Longimicrobiales bacterium]|nr:sigma-54 dependent transcriptional regulator [Longimicrobiales bacterium]
MSRSILVVDDDARILTALSEAIADETTEVRIAASAESALAAMGRALPDVVLSDLRMPGMDGIELLRLLRERAPATEVVIMTAYQDLPTVATAMREGAQDFLVKPLDLHQLRRLLDRIFEDRRTRERSRRNSTAGAHQAISDRLVGSDRRLIEIFKLIGRVASSRSTVIIRGESGTGKELIAREIHDGSPYADEPFVAVNCTAMPETLLESELFGHVRGAFTGAARDRKGRFALAGKGTVFLDEIGDTSAEFQSKLLRVLQEHEYYPVGAERPERTEARVIAATHRNLERMLAAGEFREDLYYRLRVVEIEVPPLRERMSDVPDLAEHFIAKASRSAGRDPQILAQGALDRLLGHSWPGNVRELENCVTRAVLTAAGDVIRPENVELIERPDAEPGLDMTLAEAERRHVIRILAATGGHKTKSAEILGISRPRLDRLIARYELELPGSDDEPGEVG